MKSLFTCFFISLFTLTFSACSTSEASSVSSALQESTAGDTSFPRDDHGEVLPFYNRRNDSKKVDAAIIEAARSGKKALIVMGANWCHDSRSLATHLETPRFKDMIRASYILEYVDVGQKNKNQDIAKRFGLDGTPGTPTVLIIDGTGTLLNSKEAPTWRNAASRSENEIFDYFERYAMKATQP
ncbi:thioredoxin family protein [Litorimonas haliclonae]|uniref:thioredoxin family protein n=1 Tax=Litorimonas haliclonae TaxID=2081977 RepID=UPI0039EE9527